MSEPHPVSILAPDDFFAACISGAERAGLVLLGRAAIDSVGHAMRNRHVVAGTNIPTVLYLRHTTLFFSLPGSAFLLQATYVEEQNPDYEAAGEGRLVAVSRHPYWKLNLACGTLPGLWEASETWLYVAERFDGTRFYVSDVPYMSHEREANKNDWIEMRHRSRTAFDKERDVCDGLYGSLLGYYPDSLTADGFGEAMSNMVEALRPHLRKGRLTNRHTAIHVIPLDKFPGCADAFVAQFPPKRLLAVMDDLPRGLQHENDVANMVDIANRVYADE